MPGFAMRKMLPRMGVGSIAMMLGASVAGAHVTVSPAQSTVGKREVYTLTVPTEGPSPTKTVELDVPDGVTVVSVNAPAKEYTLIKEGARITNVRWSVNIPPGGGTELRFIAQNSSGSSKRILWNVHQVFADGSKVDWIDPPPAHPAPSTRLLPK